MGQVIFVNFKLARAVRDRRSSVEAYHKGLNRKVKLSNTELTKLRLNCVKAEQFFKIELAKEYSKETSP